MKAMEFFERVFGRFMTNLENFLTDFLTQGLWKFLLCVIIILAAMLLKSFISKCIFKLIKKKTAKKDGADSTLGVILDVLDRPIQLLVVSAALYICAAILGLVGTYSVIASKCVETLILIAVFWVLLGVTKYIKPAIAKVTKRADTHLDEIAADYLTIAAKAVVFILGALCVLQVWVDNISGLIAGLSIGGVAIALAAQDTAANIFGSVTVMLDHPFDIGEYIEVDGVAGTVEKMGLRSTRIRTLDQALVIVPNKTLSSANITNWTKIDRRRVTFNIGVTYSTTKTQLEELIERIKNMLETRDDIRNDGIAVGFADFGESALLISVRFYTLTGDVGDAATMRGKVNFDIMEIVNEMGLSFAYPTRSVYIESAPQK